MTSEFETTAKGNRGKKARRWAIIAIIVIVIIVIITIGSLIGHLISNSTETHERVVTTMTVVNDTGESQHVFVETISSFEEYVDRISEIFYNETHKLFEVPDEIWYRKEGKVYIFEANTTSEYVNMLECIRYNYTMEMERVPDTIMYTLKEQP